MAKEQLTIEAQEAVNELWAEQVIPFKLTAHNVEASGEHGNYTVHFFDSRYVRCLSTGTLRKGRLREPFEKWGSTPSGKGHDTKFHIGHGTHRHMEADGVIPVLR